MRRAVPAGFHFFAWGVLIAALVVVEASGADQR